MSPAPSPSAAPASAATRAGARAGDRTAEEGAPERRDQAHQRRFGRVLGLSASAARGAPGRRHRPFVLAELAKGRMRTKIPQLQEALATRFDISHHGVLVAGLLAHIDALDQAVGKLEARIGIATAPTPT